MPDIRLRRIYEPATEQDGYRVLVDRVWPRGVSKKDARIDYWAKDIAPSTELRKWFNHDPAKWDRFRDAYRKELEERISALRGLLDDHGDRPITLVFGAKDTTHNQAVVIKDVLEEIATH